MLCNLAWLSICLYIWYITRCLLHTLLHTVVWLQYICGHGYVGHLAWFYLSLRDILPHVYLICYCMCGMGMLGSWLYCSYTYVLTCWHAIGTVCLCCWPAMRTVCPWCWLALGTVCPCYWHAMGQCAPCYWHEIGIVCPFYKHEKGTVCPCCWNAMPCW